jgi:hypothetical protein
MNPDRERETDAGAGQAEVLLGRVAVALSEFLTLERSADADAGGELEGTHEGVWCSIEVEQRDGVHEAHLFTLPAVDLPPSSTLFRWVAVTANRFRFGSLGAYVRDDGMVNLNFTHSVVVDDAGPEVLRRTLLPVVYTAVELRREAWSLFGA